MLATAPVPPSASQALKDLAKLQQDLPKTELWFQQLKTSWLNKYDAAVNKGSDEEDDDLGKGATFPDKDRTERLDIPALLKAQPKNVEAEFHFHEELFKKLKFTYVEQKAKEGFLKRVLDVPPRFPSQTDLKDLEARAANEKEQLRARKTACKEMRGQVEELIVSAYNGHAALTERAQQAAQTMEEHKTLENELEELAKHCSPARDGIDDRERVVQEQDAVLAELQEQVNHWKSKLDYRQSKNATLEAEVAKLRSRGTESDSAAAEALRISKSKDPQLEKLGKWYREQTLFLKRIQGVREIRHPKNSADQIEIVWDLVGNVSCTLLIAYHRDYTAPSGYVLDAKFTDVPYQCSIADILLTANTQHKSLEGMLRHLTQHVPLRVRNLTEREREMEALAALAVEHEHDIEHMEDNNPYTGVSYDPETRQVMVHVDATGRTFALRLDENYPWAGADGIRVVAVEPRVGDESMDEAEEWTTKCRTSGVRTVKDFIPLLK
ncbi:hypothetical protein PhCBS80983_g03033 [Powellomyces hirtus]|uniref:Kinetochore protein Sos7 coiled-coil domain-containing protein n=1 Tax=Powellomyces hirtus TaxID=109895 RepID=A0A507E5D4_9FUNG|nr:hypothetical protein PhCBS80983_g03033 [Powellomyces hirtus]